MITARWVHRYVSPRQRELSVDEARIRQVAYALKGDDVQQMSFMQALAASARAMAERCPVRDPHLVPIPDSRGSTRMNKRLADRIAGLLGGEARVYDVLRRKAPSEPSHERRRRGLVGLRPDEHHFKVRTAQGLDPRKVVFVDNVATTGGTLEAARRALGAGAGLVWAKADPQPGEADWCESEGCQLDPPRGRANVQRRFEYIRKQFGVPVACATARMVTGATPRTILFALTAYDWNASRLEQDLQDLPERTVYDRYLPWLALQLHRMKKGLGEDDYLLSDGVEAINRAWPGIRDWLVQNRPPQVGQMTWLDAQDASDQWHAELALAAELAGEDVRQQDQGLVWFTWPDGWTLQELRPDQLDSEGDAMGHCVGGHDYRARVEHGETMIASLRDPLNQPHVTFEVDIVSGAYQIVQSKGKGNDLPLGKHRARAWEAAQLLRGDAQGGKGAVTPETAPAFGEAAFLMPDTELMEIAIEGGALGELIRWAPHDHSLSWIHSRLSGRTFKSEWFTSGIMVASFLRAWLEPGGVLATQVAWDIAPLMSLLGEKLTDYVLISHRGPEGFGSLANAYGWGYRDERQDPVILFDPGHPEDSDFARSRNHPYGPAVVEEWLAGVIEPVKRLLDTMNRSHDGEIMGVQSTPMSVRINRRPLHWAGSQATDKLWPPDWVFLTTTYRVQLPVHDLDAAARKIDPHTFSDAVTSDTEELDTIAKWMFGLPVAG